MTAIFQFVLYIPFALWFITLPIIIIGGGISLYKRRVSFFIYSIIAAFLTSNAIALVYLFCCFNLRLP